MNEIDYKSSKFQIERSLLQKAVRRGDVELTEKVVAYLLSVGDKDWLRDRLFVIAYEECWPIANQIQIKDLVFEYKKIALTVKNKNAWGLAELAGNFSKNNYKLDSTQSDDFNAGIIYLAKVLKDPENFWEEIKDFSGYHESESRIISAQKALNRAKFPGDKAMMYAAGYLSIYETVPPVEIIQPINNPDFPYWVAFDKHTDYGKMILQQIAEKLGMDYHTLKRMTFYNAGVVCNEIKSSPYFDALIDWRNRQMKGLQERWPEVEAMIIEETKAVADKLIMRISNPPQKNDDGQQSLF
ncbi:MAG: hypothetical protein P4L35_09050 [Ignavibacteriaceae bacterium]|nr:hypothetical protein [Ignavibacteriaceae bacterium]